MATCAKCKTEETEWYESGVPMCFSCANARQEAKLDSMERASAASAGGSSRSDTAYGVAPKYDELKRKA
jgi:hypothetical protein